MADAETMDEVKKRLAISISDHDTALDAWSYNTLTVLSLMLSAFSSVAANLDKTWSIAVSIASAAAALAIAVERALGLGARWRYHSEMKSAYRMLLDGIDFAKTLPEDRKSAFMDDWWSKLVALRSREGQIPNSGGGQS